MCAARTSPSRRGDTAACHEAPPRRGIPFALIAGVLHSHEPRRLTLGAFATVYVAAVLAAIAVTAILDERFDVDSEQGVLVFLGALFVVAATGRPWWLFQTVRALRWFAFVRSDAILRLVLLALGMGAAAVGLFVDLD